ncbi:PREDICTED: protein enabled homolog isoform X2 [Camelina sativa]|uniref:Protein enabled homolog isoform X1 n=1 Tax=Camelina sativa TaxID=90675 RepID=A0ABM0TGW3_CAMSA|nr:PREDICTED: protein enabled homolog isoform X1 [Camelina sativa]XP_010426251.1 PREDICTED: protein enabled homolog isoform X2 [Camelina sativa]
MKMKMKLKKKTKGGKAMNPTDVFRKEQRQKELFRNKLVRDKVREVGILKKDPEQIKEQIRKLDMSKAEGALDKARKHKKRQLEDTLQMVVKKRKEHEEKMKEQGKPTTSVMFSHLPQQRRTGEEDARSRNLTPQDSVYYHPTLNPTGAPPHGKPPMYKSSIGPGIPLDGVFSIGAVSSSNTESEDALVTAPPPPPLPINGSSPGSTLPLPPPPPLPPNPPVPTTGLAFPPPPPGPPPNERVSVRPPLPPPPPLSQSSQLPPPGLTGSETGSNILSSSDQTFSDHKVSTVTFIPPPPPGLPPKPVSNGSDGGPLNTNTSSSNLQDANFSTTVTPPLLPQHHQPALLSNLQPDLLHPGVLHFPPLPPDMCPPPGPPPHGMLVHLGVPRLPYARPPPMTRPPLPPGPAPNFQDGHAMSRPYVPQKPSYVKAAAPTVVKRPLAQHTPELTSMVPASVRVKRESVATIKPKPNTLTATTLGFTPRTITTYAAPVKPASATNTSAPSKPQSIDASYSAFLEDMKALGALDG